MAAKSPVYTTRLPVANSIDKLENPSIQHAMADAMAQEGRKAYNFKVYSVPVI